MSIAISRGMHIITEPRSRCALPLECHYCERSIRRYPFFSRRGNARGTKRKCYHMKCARRVGFPV